MPTIREIIDSQANGSCSTSTVRGLSLQIIGEMNLRIPNVLVSFEDLNIVPASSAVNPYLQPAAKDALRRAINAKGTALSLTSAYRTVAQQYLLHAWAQLGQCGIILAARPGRSNHEDGLAIDTPDFSSWKTTLVNEGWNWLGNTDPVHFSYVLGGVRDDIGDIGVAAFQQLWNKHNSGDPISVDGIWGAQTAARMDRSPAEGFGGQRLLILQTPNMRGSDVQKVQQALVNAGFLTEEDVDGFYGPDIERAVRRFQEDRELSVDGIVGHQTRRALGIIQG